MSTVVDEVRFVGNIRRLRLRPGDTIVIELDTSDPRSFEDAVLRLRPMLNERFPENEIMFLGPGTRVGVLAR